MALCQSRRPTPIATHFLLMSQWDSLQSIAAFAGDDIDRARYYPEDSRYLVELEPTVTHYCVVSGPDAGA